MGNFMKHFQIILYYFSVVVADKGAKEKVLSKKYDFITQSIQVLFVISNQQQNQ